MVLPDEQEMQESFLGYFWFVPDQPPRNVAFYRGESQQLLLKRAQIITNSFKIVPNSQKYSSNVMEHRQALERAENLNQSV